MDHQLFFHVTCDYYIRCYELNPQLANGLQVTIYAECSHNATGVNGHYYSLDLYFSADEIPTRAFITGVSFGERQMDKCDLDKEIDNWVITIINQDSFPLDLKDYMRKEEMWAEAQFDE